MKIYIARDSNNALWFHNLKPQLEHNPILNIDYWISRGDYYEVDQDLFPEVTFENSPSKVEIIEKSTLDEVYKGLDQYENFLGMVACMRRAQKEANDMITQVECYEEAMEHVKKAEELESMVDKWLEGEAL